MNKKSTLRLSPVYSSTQKLHAIHLGLAVRVVRHLGQRFASAVQQWLIDAE